MKAKLVCDALTMDVWQRQPKAGLIVHSDQGVQYASHQYGRLLKINGFVGSMSKKVVAGIMPLQKASSVV